LAQEFEEELVRDVFGGEEEGEEKSAKDKRVCQR